jgi:peptide/nickel transport system permease protein
MAEEAEGLPFESFANYQARKQKIAQSLHLDRPPFYLSVAPKVVPRNLYSISSRASRKWYKQLIYKTNRPSDAKGFIDGLSKIELLISKKPNAEFINLKNELARIKNVHDINQISRFANILGIIEFEKDEQLAAIQTSTIQHIKNLSTGKAAGFHFGLLLPKIMWHGTNNQYHHWVKNFVKGDFGLSDFDRRPVKTRIWSALKWTLIINIVSIFLAYMISIPLGVYSAYKVGSSFDKNVSWISMMLYALPSFWVATLAITFFASSDWFHIFPSGGLGQSDSDSYFSRMFEVAYHLVLPIFCVTYLALAFIIRQVRGAMHNTLAKDFIKTAKAKGLSDKQVIWKHGFKNSLLPLITLFSNILPATIAGSVVIEIIFSIPGMGRLAFNGILQQDWNLVFTIMMLATVLTLIGTLLADILYTKVDPRISLTKNNALGE